MIRKLTLAALVVLVPAFAFAAPAPAATPAPAAVKAPVKIQRSKLTATKKQVRSGHLIKKELRAKQAAAAK